MFEYRPHWAVARTLDGNNVTHLRSGWSFDKGHRTHCNAYLKWPKAEGWASADDIQNRDLTDDASNTRTCERCCMAWIRKAEANANN